MVVEVPYFENWWGGNSLKDQLSYVITDTNFRVAFAVVDEEDVSVRNFYGFKFRLLTKSRFP